MTPSPSLYPEKLRILHTEASTGWGGQEIRILDESAGMIGRGHDVHVVAAPEAPLVQAAKDRNIPVHALPLNRRRLGSLLALRTLLADLKPDVVVTHSSSDSWLTAFATRLLRPRIPIVRTRHISTPVAAGPFNRWLYGKVPSRVVTTGEAIRSHLLNTLLLKPDFVLSIPTGANMSRFQPGNRAEMRAKLGIKSRGPVIGIVATLRSWKGHRFLVTAMNNPRLRDAHLIIVGDGPQNEALHQLVNEQGLSRRVTFTGQQKDVLPWLQAFDVFVFPSTGHEGVPQALVQAMACGLPVVTTAVGAIPEVVKDRESGILVTPESAEAIANGIVQILSDANFARQLSETGRKHVIARFSDQAMLDAMEKVLQEAAAKRKRGVQQVTS